MFSSVSQLKVHWTYHAIIFLISTSSLDRLLHFVDQLITIQSFLAHCWVRAIDFEFTWFFKLGTQSFKGSSILLSLWIHRAFVTLYCNDCLICSDDEEGREKYVCQNSIWNSLGDKIIVQHKTFNLWLQWFPWNAAGLNGNSLSRNVEAIRSGESFMKIFDLSDRRSASYIWHIFKSFPLCFNFHR